MISKTASNAGQYSRKMERPFMALRFYKREDCYGVLPLAPQGSSINGESRVPNLPALHFVQARVIPLGFYRPSCFACVRLLTPPSAGAKVAYSQPKPIRGFKTMTTLFAQPYDISANGFYFETVADYEDKASKLFNSYGQFVEEFEIQFIDGDSLDCALFRALGVHQGNFSAYLEAVEDWSADDKIKLIIAVGETGYNFDFEKDSPDQFDIDLYELDSLKDLAEQFVEEGLFGNIPASIQNYLDYDAIARDLGMDYSEIRIDGTNYIYRCD